MCCRGFNRIVFARFVQLSCLMWAFEVPSYAAGSIFTSQLGYAPGDTKIAVLAVTKGTAIQSTFRVVSLPTGAEAFSSGATLAMPFYPGGWYGNDSTGDTYLLDFSSAALPVGSYRVESNGFASASFSVGAKVYDVSRYRPLELFRVQMSGVPYSWVSLDGSIGGHGADHLDDARRATRKDKGGGDAALIEQDYLALPGGRLEVSGGWSDAGDYNKYMGNTPWAAYLILLTAEEYPAYWSAVDDNHNGIADVRESVQPALEWMLKMQHTDGSTYERVFNGYAATFDGRPDLETDNRIGTTDDRPLDTDRYADIAVKSAYAWALGYRIFRDTRYLNAAVRAWDWAFANQTRVKPKVYGGGLYFGDVEIGLTLSALELHRAELAAGLVPSSKYLTFASAHVRSHLDAANWTNPSSWDFQQSYALIRYFDLASPADQSRILTQLKARWDAGIQNQSRNAYRMNDEWLYGDFGQNENSSSGAGDALWLFARTGERKYYDYAVNQMSWIFGRNPFGESWLSTQYVTEYTRVPHLRATGKHAIEGVVVPGATDRNANHLPDYTDTGDWFYGEPSINQQAMFLRVMTSLYFASGGVINTPTDPPPAVSIISPSDGSTLVGTVTITASVSDSGGVSNVSYRIGSGALHSMLLLGGTSNNGQWQATLSTLALIDGVHKITVIGTDTANQQSSPFVNVNISNNSQQSLHVDRIGVVLNQKGGNSRIQARGDVFIHDAFGVPIAGASVVGHWEGAANDTFTVSTDATGKATDYSNSVTALSGSSFICVVESVSKSAWQYQPSGNKQSSGSVVVP
jgi:endoglucanase